MRFFITHNAVTSEVFPEYQNLLFSTNEKDKNYRTNLKVDFRFKGQDYDTLISIDSEVNRCLDITFEVRNNDGITIAWSGLLKINSLRFNKNACIVTGTPELKDSYNCLYENWDNDFDVLTLTEQKARTKVGAYIYQSCSGAGHILDDSCLTTPAVWSLKKTGYYIGGSPSYTPTHTIEWVTEEATTTCVLGAPVEPVGGGWTLITNDCAGSGTATYRRPPSTTFDYCNRVQNGGQECFYKIAVETEVTNGRKLEDILTALTSTCGLTIKSNFLSINAVGADPATKAYLNKSDISNLLIFQKSDIKRPFASNPATVFDLNLKQCLEWLNDILDIEYEINSGVMVLEHSSFYTSANGNDLSNENSIKGTNQYTYKQLSNPFKEKFLWYETTTDKDFKGIPIIYDNACANKELTTTVTPKDIYTDISEAQKEGTNVSDSGYFLVATVQSGGNNYIINKAGLLTGKIKLNGVLCWSNIQDKYKFSNRPQLTGSMNNVLSTFESTTFKKLGMPITVKMDLATYQSINFKDKIKTLLEWGEIESFEYNLNACTATIKLRHE